MVRSVVVEGILEKYLDQLSSKHKISIGLIIGQPQQQGKEYVIHLARTLEDQPTLGVPLAKPIDSILEINNDTISNHSLSVIRMIPAGFYILGVFITSPTSVFDDSEAFRKIKLILVDINETINSNGLLSGSSDEYDKGEKLVLHYSSISHQTVCKSVEITDSVKSMVSKPVDLKYQDRSASWNLFETYYELDEIFPLIKTGVRINTEENLNKSLKSISEQLKKSMVFFDGEHISETETLESLNKSKKNKENPIQVTIYLPCSNEDDSDKIKQIQGTVRYSGIISSRVYAHSKNTIRDIQNFIKNDIIRSLAARTQIHCDALMENEVTDGVIINEPPRRVYFPIKTLPNIQFCDYLFRGESEETATRQIKELLDIELARKEIISDVESLPETIDESDSNEGFDIKVAAKPEVNKTIYLIGISSAVLVLLISLLYQFVFK